MAGAKRRLARSKPKVSESPASSRAAYAAILLALLSLGLLVAGVSFLLSRSEDAWWTVPLPALGTYALLLIGLYFKDQSNPVAKLVGTVVDAVSSRVWLAAPIALATTSAAVALGYHVYTVANQPDGELRFIVYERHNIEGQRHAGLTLELEHLIGSAATLTQTTNDRGLASFPVSLGDVVTVRLTRRDGRIYVFYQNRTVTESDLDRVADVIVAAVPEQAWLTRANVEALDDQMGSMRIDAALLRWQPGTATRLVGDPAAAAQFAPLGLPEAEIVIARPPFVAGFSPVLKQPRWVASRVSGLPVGRRGNDRFAPDPLIPAELQASPRDYARQGDRGRRIYDRGHLARHADLGPVYSTSNERNFMTMVAPQATVTNRRLWLDLEEYTSALKLPTNEVYILRGPAFVSATDGQISVNLIGVSRLPVATHYFQVVAVVEPQRTIYHCHLVPNTTQVGLAGRGETPVRFRATLPEIEAATGLRLFPQLAGAGRPCQPA